MPSPLALKNKLRKSVLKATAPIEIKEKVIEEIPQDAVLTNFIQFAHNYFPEHLYCSDSLFHDWIKERLGHFHQDRGQRQAIIAPRGSAKSTWVTLIYVLYCALFRIEHYVIIISDTDKQSKLFLKRIKDELESNKRLRDEFPVTCSRWKIWQSSAIELMNGVRVECVGKGGKIRGRIHHFHRPTLIILDDPQNLDDAYNEEQLEKDYDWLKSDVLKAGSPNTNIVILGTALAPKCLVCLLERSPTWKHNRFKQLIQEPNRMDLWIEFKNILFNPQDDKREDNAKAFYQARPEMNEGSQVLWESRFPLYDVMVNRYSLGERVFDQEEQGNPRVPGQATFPAEYFEHAQFWFDEWPEGNLCELWALDPSKGKQDKQGDYQALVRVVVDRYYQFWVEAWLEKMPVQELCEFVFDKFRNQPGEALVLESNGFQELLKIPLDLLSEAHKVALPIYQVINSVNKNIRIYRLDPHLSKRNIHFKKNSPGTLVLVNQLMQHRVPMPKGTHDDGPDVLEMGIRVAIKLVNSKSSG